MKKIKGSGNIISENRELTNFSSINLIGGIDVNIKFSEKYNCTVVSDENLIPYIKTEVVNNNHHLQKVFSLICDERLEPIHHTCSTCGCLVQTHLL